MHITVWTGDVNLAMVKEMVMAIVMGMVMGMLVVPSY